MRQTENGLGFGTWKEPWMPQGADIGDVCCSVDRLKDTTSTTSIQPAYLGFGGFEFGGG